MAQQILFGECGAALFSFVNLFSISNFNYRNCQYVIVDFVNDTIIADPNTIGFNVR